MKYKYLLLILLVLLYSSAYCQKSQEPKGTQSYISEEIVFDNLKDNIKLAGTFTYPKNAKNFPVAILISGSGPQDRNSELLGHKPFLVIADDFTKKGIAVLRVDDRGTGGSGGNYNTTSLDGFVNDSKAAVEYLKTRKEIDRAKIGLVGHSLGGVIAPIIAAESSDLAYIVMLAGSGIRGDKLMLLQKASIERKMGIDELSIEMGQKSIGGAYEIIVASSDRGQLENDLATYFTNAFGSAIPASQVTAISKQLTVSWLVDFIKLDPSISLSKVKCPILALIGSNDTQVPPTENLAAIKSVTEKSGNKDVTVMELLKLNHLFQESESGLPQEYEKIEQTFSPVAMNLISEWILKRTK